MEKNVEFAEYIRSNFNLSLRDIKSYSPLTLAFMGDSIYDLIIRTIIVSEGNAPVNKLHKRVSGMVKASAQADMIKSIYDLLTEEEIAVYKRGRNAKSFTIAKNASLTDYKMATGFETLIGYLYLTDKLSRVIELINEGFRLYKLEGESNEI